MPVIGNEYYRCRECGGSWFFEQRRYRIRQDMDMEFFSEEEASITPAPVAQAQVDYICAECGEPLVRNGLRRFVRKPPAPFAVLRSEIESIKAKLSGIQGEEAAPASEKAGGASALEEVLSELSARIEKLEELVANVDGDAGSPSGEPAGDAGEDRQSGGDPAPDGDGTEPKRGRKKAK